MMSDSWTEFDDLNSTWNDTSVVRSIAPLKKKKQSAWSSFMGKPKPTKLNKHNHKGLHLQKNQFTETLEAKLSDEVITTTRREALSPIDIQQAFDPNFEPFVYEDPSLDMLNDDTFSSSSQEEEEKKQDDFIERARAPPPPPLVKSSSSFSRPVPEIVKSSSSFTRPVPEIVSSSSSLRSSRQQRLKEASHRPKDKSKPAYLAHKNKVNPRAQIHGGRLLVGRDIVPKNNNKTMTNIQELQNTSVESLSAVGSDIQRLRSILRRKKKPIMATTTLQLPTTSEDPMQQAGMRLLSAAVVPIQAQVRRYLALKHALTRMWAVIVLQSFARKYLARKVYVEQKCAAIQIQSVYRGSIVREDILIQHCCAMEIQRFVRGYLHALKAYEKLYKITLVQSVIRRKLAIEHATDRMVFIIQLQSVARRFLERKHREDEQEAALRIQTRWRAFWCNCNYELDLLDIVVAQNAYRRWKAQKIAKELRIERDSVPATIIQRVARPFALRTMFLRKRAAAITIQKTWRSFDCTMNYLNYVADVITVQSVARRWLVLREVNMALEAIHNDSAVVIQKVIRAFLGNKLEQRYAATTIQSAWRGFVSYADYMFTLTDIVVTQSVARRWLMRNKLVEERKTRFEGALVSILKQAKKQGHKENAAATTIQRNWRGFIRATEYFIIRTEHRAATSIQSSFRRFVQFSKYIIFLDGVIYLQSMFRMRKEKLYYDALLESALKVQCATRMSQAKTRMITKRHVKMMIEDTKRVGEIESTSAVKIQSLVRGKNARFAFRMYRSILKIQTFWRSKSTSNAFDMYRMTRKLQAFWRGHCARKVFAKLQLIEEIRKGRYATKIQRVFRGHSVRSNGLCFTNWIEDAHIRNLASEEIQRMWRGYIIKIMYWRQLGSSLQIQKWYRGTIVRQSFMQNVKAATKIQSIMRMKAAKIERKQRFIIMLLVKTAAENKKLAQEKAMFEAKIEKFRKNYAARKIQAFFLWVRKEVDREVSRAVRRNSRKKSSRKMKRGDDRVLETVWSTAIESQTKSRDTLEGLDMNSRASSSRLKIPSAYSLKQQNSKLDDDQVSMISGFSTTLSTASSWVKPRARMSNQERDLDFNLETAWIDAEINDAKERRSKRKTKVTISRRKPAIYS